MVQIRFILCALLTLFAAGNAAADSQHVRSLKLHVDLEKDGAAKVYERWDVATGDNITEWYLVRDNLGDIVIDSLEVCVDEVPSHFEGEWNVDRTLGEKAGKCGIVHRASGVELCWGIGSHGDHVFEAVYRMHGAVKSARDYDYLHLQLVSPGLSSPPEQVQVFLGSDYVQLDTTAARVWGFGYEGICIFENGQVVMESDGPFGIDDSVIVLLRLDKGILEPTSLRDQDFQEVLDTAMEEADFGNYEPWEEDDTETLIGLGLLGLGFLGRGRQRSITGRRRKHGIILRRGNREIGCFRFLDDGSGHIIGQCQQHRHHQTDDGQYRDRHHKIFSYVGFGHDSTPPNGLLRVHLMMNGVKMFITRIEKDTPSG